MEVVRTMNKAQRVIAHSDDIETLRAAMREDADKVAATCEVPCEILPSIHAGGLVVFCTGGFDVASYTIQGTK